MGLRVAEGAFSVFAGEAVFSWVAIGALLSLGTGAELEQELKIKLKPKKTINFMVRTSVVESNGSINKKPRFRRGFNKTEL